MTSIALSSTKTSVKMSGTMKKNRRKNWTKYESQLFDMLKDIYHNKEFVIGIMNSIRTDDGRKEMLEFINKGKDVTVTELTLMSIDIGREEKN